jgi:hypothetical protein
VLLPVIADEYWQKVGMEYPFRANRFKRLAGAPGFEPGNGGIKISPTRSEVSAYFHNSCDVHVIAVQGLISAVEAVARLTPKRFNCGRPELDDVYEKHR